MDEKHAMMYPALDPSPSNSHDQRTSASAAIGLPLEAPPSYDMAISGGGRGSSIGVAPMGFVPALPASHNDEWGRVPSAPVDTGMHAPMPVIVEQPLPTSAAIPAQPQLQQQQQPLPNVTVVTTKLGPNPCAVQCPVCGACKTTRMQYTPNSKTHLFAFILCLVGWCCCACCVPYCMNSCRTGNHYCSKCNTFLGSYDPKLINMR